MCIPHSIDSIFYKVLQNSSNVSTMFIERYILVFIWSIFELYFASGFIATDDWLLVK